MVAIALSAPASAAAGAIVTLTFDDTLVEHEQAAQLLKAHGMRGTFFVNSPRLDQPGYLTADGLRAMQAAGHEIGGHTVHHPRLAGLDAGEVERQICNDRAALLQAGLEVRSFAYPFGAADPAVQAAAIDCGYNSARGVGGGGDGDTVPPTNPLYLRTLDSLQCHSDLPALLTKLRRAAQANDTRWFVLVLHHLHPVCDAPYTLGWETFVALLDWLEEEGGERLQVRTLQQMFGGPTHPAVLGRPAPVRSPHGNLLLNPSLEALSASGSLERPVPQCWQQAGWGDNDALWLQDPHAVHGDAAHTVTITRHTSGARRLVSSQDLGACAPRPVPGESYLLTGWYRSSAPVYWKIYYRDAHATWHPWAMSPWYPPTADFSFRMWRPPPVPAEAEALSVGLSIASLGSLTVDALSLQLWDEIPPELRAAYEQASKGLSAPPPS